MEFLQSLSESPPLLALAATAIYHELRLTSIEIVLGIGRFKDLKAKFKK